jgi:hypothetical protein
MTGQVTVASWRAASAAPGRAAGVPAGAAPARMVQPGFLSQVRGAFSTRR